MKTIIEFIKDRANSFRCAYKGLLIMLKYEHNAWIHTLATLLVVIAGIAADINRYEWGLIVLAIVAVWTAEALNTAFEFLCDVASPNFHPMVEKAKDVAAGAVLISSIGSVAVGIFVFGPHLAAWLLRTGSVTP